MNRYTLTLKPDWGDALFWDEDGNLVGHCSELYLYYEEPNEIRIDLSPIAGLKEWYYDWCKYDDDLWFRHKGVDKEMINNWCKQGIALSKEVKKLLPDNVDVEFVCSLSGEKFLIGNYRDLTIRHRSLFVVVIVLGF
ncbi:MAG: hypothetical protein K6G73_05690 [Marinilabiliaceae bacterium]|nr:hypothetical protein [Marinilabiliaceae bacterium]